MKAPPEGDIISQAQIKFHPRIQDTFRMMNPNLGLKTNHMQRIGFASILKGKYKDSKGLQVPCAYYQRFCQEKGRDPIGPRATHGRSIMNQARFEKSVMKCDVPPTKPPDDDQLWRVSKEYTQRMFSRLRGSRPVEVFDINESTSPGKPYTSMGFKTKADFMSSSIFPEEMKACHVPMWSICDKFEFLPLEDLVFDEKLRTFFIPSIDFLTHQKILFDDQNSRVLRQCRNFSDFWPRYGFVKQYGGFDDLMKHHEGKHNEFDIHFTVDISGFDRVVSLLPEVYEQRKYYLNIGESFPFPNFERYVDYVIENTCRPYCCMPDGSIYRRQCGNGSGSNNTTVDNCWAHVMVTFYCFLKLGMKLFNRVLTYEEIIENVRVSLYGDDNLASLRRSFWYPEGFDEESFKADIRSFYMDFNMKIKERAFVVSQGTVEGLEFLGSTAYYSKRHRMYFPRPRLGKLCTSITQVLDEKVEQGVANSVKAFYDIVSDIDLPEEQFVKNFLMEYAQFLISQDDFCNAVTAGDIHHLELIASGRLPIELLSRGHEGHVTLKYGYA